MTPMPPMPAPVRKSVVEKLAVLFALSTVVQLAIYLISRWLLQIALSDIVNLTIKSPPPAFAGAMAGVLIIGFLLNLLAILAVGFFGARATLRQMRKTVPAHLPTPTAPIPWTALTAGALLLAFDLLRRTLGGALDAGAVPDWLLILVRDAIIISVWWFAALRAVTNARGKAIAAPLRPKGSTLVQQPS